MRHRFVFPLAFVFAAGIAVAAAAQQPPVPAQAPAQNIRGTITAFDGKVLSVHTREGQDLALSVPDTTNVAIHKAFALADIKPGMMLAAVTLPRADGSVIVLNIRPLPATAQGSVNPYDLAPGASMNNTAVEQVLTVNGAQQIILNTTKGPVTALIVPQTTMTQTAPGTRTDLKVGEMIFATARPDAAGKLTVARLEVGKDGIEPGE
jgi:hypothetical protein